METIIGGGEIKAVNKKIKCFILASGMSVISEYEEVETRSIIDGEKDIDLYFLNPMVANFARTPDNRIITVMSPLVIFSRDCNRMGPINPCTIVFTYEIEQRYITEYENRVVELREARLGLVNGKKINMNKLKQQLKIGGGLKINK